MAESKRYYWLKLQHDFFGSKRVKKLRRMENGDTCVIIYLKMQLKSIKNDGVLVYSGLENSFEEELALDLDEDVEDVKRTVAFLLAFGMLEVETENQYVMPYAKDNTGSETAAAGRMREFRKKKDEQEQNSSEQSENNVTQSSPAKEAEQKLPAKVPSKEKPKKETVMQVYERIKDEGLVLPYPVDLKMQEWLKYKSERKEPYKETGLKSLIKQVSKYTAKYGNDAVCDLIDKCMSSNWAGIIWERLDKGNFKTKSERIGLRVSEVDNW